MNGAQLEIDYFCCLIIFQAVFLVEHHYYCKMYETGKNPLAFAVSFMGQLTEVFKKGEAVCVCVQCVVVSKTPTRGANLRQAQ